MEGGMEGEKERKVKRGKNAASVCFVSTGMYRQS